MLKVKIITGFRKDQEYTIEADEAHKAYHLFLNPKDRAIFKSGLALKGEDIRAIEPDIHATMGWNKDHKLDAYDYQEIESKGIQEQFRDLLAHAKNVAQNQPELLSQPLSEPKRIIATHSQKLVEGMKL